MTIKTNFAIFLRSKKFLSNSKKKKKYIFSSVIKYFILSRSSLVQTPRSFDKYIHFNPRILESLYIRTTRNIPGKLMRRRNLSRIRWETKPLFPPFPSHRTRRGYFYGSIDVRTHAIGRVYCFCRPVPDVRRIYIFCTVPTVRPIVSNRLPNCSTSSISSHFCMTMKIRTVSTSMFERGSISSKRSSFFFFSPKIQLYLIIISKDLLRYPRQEF